MSTLILCPPCHSAVKHNAMHSPCQKILECIDRVRDGGKNGHSIGVCARHRYSDVSMPQLGAQLLAALPKDRQESGRTKGRGTNLGRLSRTTLAFDKRRQAKLRMQFSKQCLESAVEHCTANLQQLMCALCRPAHGLALTHSLIYQSSLALQII
jgi:hypothetical protein